MGRLTPAAVAVVMAATFGVAHAAPITFSYTGSLQISLSSRLSLASNSQSAVTLDGTPTG
jgi:uncharacterized protein involved in exopolysaccharide biosynthesis